VSQYTDLRIVWIRTGSGFSTLGKAKYWMPILREFINVFPRTTIIATGEIHPYYKTMLNVHPIGRARTMTIVSPRETYGLSFAWMTPKLLIYLLRHDFDIIITMEYSIVALYAVIVRSLKGTRILLLKEGNHPVETVVKRWYRTYISSHVDIHLANTVPAQQYLQQTLLVPRDKIICRPYLVPPEPTIPSSLPIQLPRSPLPIFLFVGQLIPRKGVLHLLEAATIVKRQGKRFSIWLVGDGIQRQEIEQKIHDSDLGDTVRLFGSIPYEQVGLFYNTCDVFILPTLADYRSVAVMEAAKHGKPLLDSKYDGGASEFIHHGENGFVFDPRNHQELARFMLTIINSPALINTFGKKSKEIMKPYTISNAIAALQASIEHLQQARQQTR